MSEKEVARVSKKQAANAKAAVVAGLEAAVDQKKFDQNISNGGSSGGVLDGLVVDSRGDKSSSSSGAKNFRNKSGYKSFNTAGGSSSVDGGDNGGGSGGSGYNKYKKNNNGSGNSSYSGKPGPFSGNSNTNIHQSTGEDKVVIVSNDTL